MKQLTYNKLGRMGKLGNQLFEIASLIGLAKKYDRELVLPSWKYQSYFSYQISLCERGDFNDDIHEQHFHYTPDYWDSKLNTPGGRISISGWLQSEHYFEEYRNDVKEMLTFEEGFVNRIRKEFSNVLDNGKETIAISIRRGDYMGNSNYVVLPIMYYILALKEYFPDWRSKYNVIVFSDDLPYCRHHFSPAENIYFPPGGYSDVEQLCLMSLCNNFIIANSTFSWWGAWLGEKENSVIVHPAHHFAGYLYKHSDTQDYYPERWKEFNHKTEEDNDKKYPLENVTFTIPVYYDHFDRMENFMATVLTLNKYFDTNIIVGEQGSSSFSPKSIEYNYVSFDYKYFHRTKMLNIMAEHFTDTPIIVNWDVDVLLPPMAIIESVYQIEKGEDMVLPYGGKMAKIVREKWLDKYAEELDTGIWSEEILRGARLIDADSVGGAVFWNKASFIEGGMENEYFIGYGPEDVERVERFTRLGFRIKRIKGIIYHIDHYIGDSQGGNPHYTENYEELRRVRQMTNEELEEYISSWEWNKKELIK